MNFNNFLSSISKEQIQELVGSNEPIKVSFTEEDFQNYTDSLLMHSFNSSLKLLELYHNWLTENYEFVQKKNQ